MKVALSQMIMNAKQPAIAKFEYFTQTDERQSDIYDDNKPEQILSKEDEESMEGIPKNILSLYRDVLTFPKNHQYFHGLFNALIFNRNKSIHVEKEKGMCNFIRP